MGNENSRIALLIVHTGRPNVIDHAQRLSTALQGLGFTVRVLKEECGQLDLPNVEKVSQENATTNVEIVVALGGDGTLLRAAALARPSEVPLLGVNLGRVGFLAEAEAHHLDQVAHRIAERDYEVDARLTVEAEIYSAERLIARDWGLNEISVERSVRERMLEAVVEIDGHPVSRWGCDGVLAATPTGSTAYAFSAGGPVMWPNVAALLVVPVNAHALFSRPLVVGPSSTVTISVHDSGPVLVACDGRRTHSLPTGGRVVVRNADLPVRVVRLRHRSFTDRLVAKFGLNVAGWRQNPS